MVSTQVQTTSYIRPIVIDKPLGPTVKVSIMIHGDNICLVIIFFVHTNVQPVQKEHVYCGLNIRVSVMFVQLLTVDV